MTAWIAVTLLVSAEPAVDFAKQIRPLLADRCFSCHGALKKEADLRVDSVRSLGTGGESGPAIVAGRPDDSLLLERIMGGESDRMPPAEDGEALKPEEIALIKRWIVEGAKPSADDHAEPDPREHWAFRAPVRTAIPHHASQGNPIDAFIESRLAEQRIRPQPPADPRILLRRLYLDLIGLPPTLAEQEAFLADRSADAYERVVDRLLASPHYGERWGRHWMDIWRYSDWWGLGKEVRNSQKHIYHWRDWITESLNDDVGYDQMVRLMLAADELAPESLSDQRATGLLARNYFLFNRTSWMDSLIEHTSKAFLGLTFNCAKCHDHKYDPISQSDYYRYRALFEPYQIRTDLVPGTLDTEINGIPRAFDCDADAPTYLHIRGDEKRPRKDRPLGPGLPALLAPEGLAITPVPLPILAHTPGLRPHVVATYRQQAEQKLSEIRRKASNGKLSADVAQKSLAAAEHAIATLMARYEAQRAQWQAGPEDDAESLAMRAAKFEKQQAILEAEQALAESEADWLKAKADNKKEFDEKITMAKKNLETARKAAENPGKTFTPLIGAVKTKASNVESDASRNKPFPTTSTGRRSALAQWLTEPSNPLTARVAVNHIWMRHFGTPLVPTVFDFGRKGTPPTHPELLDWLACEFTAQGWSMKKLHRLIVTSAAYRRTSSPLGADAATLATDGNNRLLWRMNPIRMQSQVVRDSLLHLAGKLDPAMGGPPIPLSESDRSQRRSLYFVHSHNDQHKFLGTFDDANVLECYRRDESIVPQQALALANSSLALSMARTINERLHQDVDQLTDDEFVTKAFQTVLSCSPTASERATALKALSELKTIAQNAKIGDITSRARAIVVQALVNHNDFVTVR